MKSSIKIFASSTITGVAVAGLITSTAFAWHPKGMIKKYVQNVTQNGQMADANDAQNAVAAKPGDTLKYTIVVENDGDAASNGNNDMAHTVMTDTLPAGIVMADGSSSTISVDLGTIKPGQKVTKEYLVKVTSTKDGDLIENKACFTGDSAVNDNPQKGCDVADVKVSVPTPPSTPTPPIPPVTPPQIQAAATTLPNTGAGSFILPAGIVSGLGYFGNMLRLKRAVRKQS
jgi:uncharacterized repeat protein (TIGR01451 family)